MTALNLLFTIPTEKEFTDEYVTYKNFIKTTIGKYLYKTLIKADFINAAIIISEHLNLPPVTAANFFLKTDMSGKNMEKQFLGALTCKIMKLNGFKPIGKKKSVPIKGFTKAELFERK